MRFYIHSEYTGGDISLIQQAARKCSATLIAVDSYALADYPRPLGYVEGRAEYLFALERTNGTDAVNSVHRDIPARVRELWIEQTAQLEAAAAALEARNDKEVS